MNPYNQSSQRPKPADAEVIRFDSRYKLAIVSILLMMIAGFSFFMMIGNLSGHGSRSNRSPRFYREVRMALSENRKCT